MLGSFQSSTLRVEVAASSQTLRRCLLEPKLLKQWLWPQRLQMREEDPLTLGSEFTAWLGPCFIEHRVEKLSPYHLQLLLWGAVDGFHEWNWGNGWVQIRLEAVSYLPLTMAQVLVLRQLQAFAPHQEA